tara:strand:- start:218 stop:712 length:495 start_codon:yes stop_codon:yes gene_type:complete
MNIKDLKRFTENILRETELFTPDAVSLLLSTAAQESGFNYLYQMGEGPARSYWQVEPATALDNFTNYLDFRPELKKTILDACFLPSYIFDELTNQDLPRLSNILERNTAFALLMARIKYYRIAEKIPKRGNIGAMAKYWKDYYNTASGKGSEDEFIKNYYRLLT